MEAFHAINGHANGLGHTNHGALCQEFLSGTEFVIDGVSRDGVYKVTAIWEYDKRSVNGANFVYFGMFCRGAQVSNGAQPCFVIVSPQLFVSGSCSLFFAEPFLSCFAFPRSSVCLFV